MKEITTLAQSKPFQYEINDNIILIYVGRNHLKYKFPLEPLVLFAKEHHGSTVEISTTRTIKNIKQDSLGEFCLETVPQSTILSSYIAAIAVDINLASPTKDNKHLLFI